MEGSSQGSLRSEAGWLTFCLHPTPFPERYAKVTRDLGTPPEISPAQVASASIDLSTAHLSPEHQATCAHPVQWMSQVQPRGHSWLGVGSSE